MRREFQRHLISYLVLALQLAVFVFLFLGAWPNVVLQRVLIGFLVALYIVWGSVTHHKARHLTRRIFIEYAAVGLLGGVLLLLLTI